MFYYHNISGSCDKFNCSELIRRGESVFLAVKRGNVFKKNLKFVQVFNHKLNKKINKNKWLDLAF